MNVIASRSFFGGTETFTVGKTKVSADTGTAKVVQNSDGSIQVIGGDNVTVKSEDKNIKISLKDSKVSQFIATEGKNKIEMDKCQFQQGGSLPLALVKTMFTAGRCGEKYVSPSKIIIGGEGNDVKINGDLYGEFSCYTFGDNDATKKDKITITGNNNARIVSGMHDEVIIQGKNQSEKNCKKVDDKEAIAAANVALMQSMMRTADDMSNIVNQANQIQMQQMNH